MALYCASTSALVIGVGLPSMRGGMTMGGGMGMGGMGSMAQSGGMPQGGGFIGATNPDPFAGL